ncbi:MAG: methionine--tRNA ligase [Patescibacteria group bacterium]|nr:methionine--tRNA ligase [Patescibacteria group bacterium]
MTKPFYITTAIPYVNASPHLGHALEFVQADVLARFYRTLGHKVITLTGSDENALKNVQAAERDHITPKELVDKNSQLFLKLTKELKTHFDVFQRTTSDVHVKSCQDLWLRCQKDIYKKNYQGRYCVGCEAFYSDDELLAGECPEHPGKKLEIVGEENYFFRLSRYHDQLIEILSTDKIRIIPEKRKNEILSFLKKPLQDISISRTITRARNWGIPVPNDPSQRIYVWFDALNAYRSGVSDDVWPADIHIIGKGIVRFHAVYWPAFLISANLPLPKIIFVHGYFTVNGKKMSKTLGNVVDPLVIINRYGADCLRYYMLKEISPFDDGDFSLKRLEEIYQADLANELGNLVLRLTTLAEKDKLYLEDTQALTIDEDISQHLKSFEFNLAIESLWRKIKRLNKKLDEFSPWRKAKKEREYFLKESLIDLKEIGFNLQPFLPETANKIQKTIKGKIRKTPPLFPKSE